MDQYLIEVNESTFDSEVINSEKLCLVDFWADWCGPCKALKPILEKLSAEKREIKFCTVNVDQNQTIPAKYQIRGIPTLILFQNGNPVATKVGACSREALIEFIEANY